MKLLVIDGQGGGIGAQLISHLKNIEQLDITAVGTNSAATSAMRKAGAVKTATGENAVVINAGKADMIVGPIGIAIADSMLGEVTPKMAQAVGSSNAERILIPFQNCGSVIIGAAETNTGILIEEAVETIRQFVKKSIS